MARRARDSARKGPRNKTSFRKKMARGPKL